MLLRYTASADTTIVNAYQPNLVTRGTGSNMGLADVLETFSIYGRQQVSSSKYQASQELSRILIKFPTTTLAADRTAGTIPASGSVSFYLKLYNAQHSKAVPRDYKLVVHPVSQSWQEGEGLDLEGYKDVTKGNPGTNWLSASDSAAWSVAGGDFLTSSAHLIYAQNFEAGTEDLELNITNLVESWLAGNTDNYGVGIYLSASYEGYFSGSHFANSGSVLNNTNGAKKSYFTKRFFARGTQYFFKKPVIEARWDSSRRDQRNEFYFSSSLAPAADNLNTIYFYNYVRGRLRNIPAVGTGSIHVSLHSGNAGNTDAAGSRLQLYNGHQYITGGYVSTGVYSCSIGIASSSTSPLFDVWHTGGVQYYTGSIKPRVFEGSNYEPTERYIINLTNLENSYRADETQRLNLFVRPKNWNPTIYTKATAKVPTTNIQSASYRVIRAVDNLEVVPYGTGSDKHTILSYDGNGNYYDFNMSLLEPGYEYKFKFSFYNDRMSSWEEQQEEFRFRVEK